MSAQKKVIDFSKWQAIDETGKFDIPQQWFQVARWKEILKRLKKSSHNLCPLWRCDDCYHHFPKQPNQIGFCPCQNYNNNYLIRAVGQIISFNEKRKV
jgi:hypothetical protein